MFEKYRILTLPSLYISECYIFFKQNQILFDSYTCNYLIQNLENEDSSIVLVCLKCLQNI